jgi:carbon starvation protein CstA
MLALRNGGMQMPGLVKKYTNGPVFNLYNVFVCLLMLLVGSVFIYTPGDIASTQVFGFSGAATAVSTWVIYAAIFIYYLAATLFPIDKLIGRVYPIFGAILLFSAIGVFVCLFAGGYELTNLTSENWKGIHPSGISLIPTFFITVACGIVSGFHSTQTAIISRSVTSEKQGRSTFYNMMILEGFIAMIWAAAAMAIMAKGLADPSTSPNAVVGIVAKDMLGPIGGMIAIIGVVVLPITSGDTALRSLRLMMADYFHIDQKLPKNRLTVSSVIFVLVAAILVWAKFSPGGFAILWRYFAWSNQTIAIFAFAIITIYLIGKGHKTAPLMSLLPGTWYAFITFSFICNAKIGLNLPMNLSYALGIAFAVIYAALTCVQGAKLYASKASMEAEIVMDADDSKTAPVA